MNAQVLLYVSVIGLLNVPAPTAGNDGEMDQHAAEPDPVIVAVQVFLMPTTVETESSGLTRCKPLGDPDGLIDEPAPLLQPAKIAAEIRPAIAQRRV